MMQGPHGYSPVQQPQWALPSEASQHRMTSVKPHLKLFGTIWHMFFMFALTSYDMLRLSTWKAGPTKPRHLLRKDPIRKERHGETEWCQSSEHTRLGDLETWRLGQPMSTENHCFPCAVEVWAHGSTATRTLSDLKLCLSCFFPPCSVGFLGSQM